MASMANSTITPLRLDTNEETLKYGSTRSRTPRTPKTPLSLDLSDLPTLISPSPPSNTLLITNLNDPYIFQPQNLQTIRSLIDQHVQIYSWSPIKSMRRIIVTFLEVDGAIKIKQSLDHEMIFDCRCKIYFGAQTDISPSTADEDRLLRAPRLDKQFFISPPPSPPQGWVMRNEGPPNKEVHADDLAVALSRLHARPMEGSRMDTTMNEDGPGEVRGRSWTLPCDGGWNSDGRKRSGSTTVVYHPEDHGHNPTLPAISVEDTTEICESPVELVPMEGIVNGPILHTARPPVELMNG